MNAAQLTREFHDKRVHIEFNDGEIADIVILVVSECNQHEECRGITYDLISPNRPDRVKSGAACWADLWDIKNFELVGD